MQLLNNLVAQNERNKLMLWVELFDSTADYKMSREAKGTENDASAAIAGSNERARGRTALDGISARGKSGIMRFRLCHFYGIWGLMLKIIIVQL